MSFLKNLPAQQSDTLSKMYQNLAAARPEVGSGGSDTGGRQFRKWSDRTGQITYGADSTPVPLDLHYVVGLHNFRHGWIEFLGTQGRGEAVVVPMVEQPVRPVPPPHKPYAKQFSDPGPRNVTEIELNCIEEPGFDLTFTAFGVSSANRISNLLGEALQRINTEGGQAGFIHPVIEVRAGKYFNKTQNRDIWHFDYKIVDWLHADGKTLESQAGSTGRIEAADQDEDAPWDDGQELTEEERRLFGA